MDRSMINKAAQAGLTPARAVVLGVILVGVTTAVVLGALGVAPPIHAAQENTVYGLTVDRVWATVVAFLALAATVTGGVALFRVNRRVGSGRKGAIVALLLGPLCLAGGVTNLILADGGLGTGNGVVAGGMALVLGLAATTLGGLALRVRRGQPA